MHRRLFLCLASFVRSQKSWTLSSYHSNQLGKSVNFCMGLCSRYGVPYSTPPRQSGILSHGLPPHPPPPHPPSLIIRIREPSSPLTRPQRSITFKMVFLYKSLAVFFVSTDHIPCTKSKCISFQLLPALCEHHNLRIFVLMFIRNKRCIC